MMARQVDSVPKHVPLVGVFRVQKIKAAAVVKWARGQRSLFGRDGRAVPPKKGDDRGTT